MFLGKMVTPAIPERVYALCKIVEQGPISTVDLKEKMEPSFLENKTSYFSDYRTAAEELNLITSVDNMITLAVEPEVVSSIQAMRHYANNTLEEFRDGAFYNVTHEYFKMGQKVFAEDQNVANLTTMMTKKTGIDIDAPQMRGWRFWVAFLGFGYMQKMFFVPNANVFLQDIIENSCFEKNKIYSFGEFMDAICPRANIIIGTAHENHVLNYGVSNGLRTLHDMGIIKMEHILDQKDIWSLYPMKAHTIQDTVTNITICK